MPTTQMIETSMGEELGLGLGPIARDPSRLRVWMKASQGKGKSHFVASIPRCFVVDTEDAFYAIERGAQPESSRFVTLGRVPQPDGSTKVIPRSSHWEKIKFYLKSDEAKKRFDTIAIDTGDRFLDDIITLLTEALNAQGKEKGRPPIKTIIEWGEMGAGWSRVRNQFCGDLRMLFGCGYGWILVSHEDEEGKSGLAPGIRKFLQQDTDFCGRIITKGVKGTVPSVTEKGEDGKPKLIEGTVRGHFMKFQPDYDGPTSQAFEKQRTPLQVDNEGLIRFGKKSGWRKFTEAITKGGQDSNPT